MRMDEPIAETARVTSRLATVELLLAVTRHGTPEN